MPQAEQLIEWLESHIPPGDSSPHARSAVCHGDYRLDNLVIEPGSLQVQAVLDWELSTLGDPWADVAYSCLPYHLPAGSSLPSLSRAHRQGDGRGGLPQGVPTETEYIALYCREAGTKPPCSQDWAFYLVRGLSGRKGEVPLVRRLQMVEESFVMSWKNF